MDLMIDLETLDTKPTAVVLSIGACFFDKEIHDEFYEVVNIDAQMGVRSVNAATLRWWLTQEKEAQAVIHKDGTNPREVLNRLSTFYEKYYDSIVWGNGSTFDISILENMYSQAKIQIPWKFWNVNDLRTFKRFVAPDLKMVKTGIYHNALDDAKNQAKFVIHALKDKEKTNVKPTSQ